MDLLENPVIEFPTVRVTVSLVATRITTDGKMPLPLPISLPTDVEMSPFTTTMPAQQFSVFLNDLAHLSGDARNKARSSKTKAFFADRVCRLLPVEAQSYSVESGLSVEQEMIEAVWQAVTEPWGFTGWAPNDGRPRDGGARNLGMELYTSLYEKEVKKEVVGLAAAVDDAQDGSYTYMMAVINCIYRVDAFERAPGNH